MASRAVSGESVAVPAPGLIVKAKRGRGRRWQIIGPGTRPGAWRLFPLGPDVGGFGGVKPIEATSEQLADAWVIA